MFQVNDKCSVKVYVIT